MYLWAELLEADARDAFTDAVEAFAPAGAVRFKATLLSRGSSAEPDTARRAFRGRGARIEPMLRACGLLG